jgi:RNA recognition motif-containing protein
MVNKATGLSKGYGFVSFAYPEDSKTALEQMDGFRVSFSSSQ